MSRDDRPNLDSLLVQALSRSPREREAFVEGACGSTEKLRNELRELLQLHEQAGDFLESPAVVLPDADRDALGDACVGEEPGAVIGRYKLLQHIGEGGFGSVFMADQLEPVRRHVALKIIKLGMDTKRVIARFEAERQALALMDHPNIARVFDAGATETGRPYFVMELVRGTPINRFCDDHRLTVRQRLELFEQVCHAVQHAHTKGVIHRDLKPSNILAVSHDGRPVPKVIDFGIAKATGGRLTDKTLFTDFRQLIGTPAYMSPEQAGMSDIDSDTRSDIYSLGVLLYELMTGSTPFNGKKLLDSGYDEMRRIIREVEPPTPSQRIHSVMNAPARSLTEAGDESDLNEIARCRDAQAPALARMFHGDLDWIVMKCLEKDRSRRYETAVALADDVRRHLANEPVLAGPPGTAYRLRKFVRRHKVGVAAGSLVAAALLLGIIGTTAGMAWALREQELADQRRVQAEAAEGREREQRELAESREKQTQQVADFQAAMLSEINVEAMGRGIKERFREQVRAALVREYVGEFPYRRKRTSKEIEAGLAAFDELTGAAQAADVGRGVMDEYVLARAAAELENKFADQPLVQAQLHLAIGQTYMKLGLHSAAETHLHQARDIEKREAHEASEILERSVFELGLLRGEQSDYAAAESLLRESVALCRRLYGDQSAQEATALTELADVMFFKGDPAEAVRLKRQALAMRRKLFGNEHSDVVYSMSDLACFLMETGDQAAAQALCAEALAFVRELPQDSSSHAITLNNLAVVLGRKNDHAEAEPLLREALAIERKLLGHEHPTVAHRLHNLAGLLEAKGDLAGAESLHREALTTNRKVLGNEHPAVAGSLDMLASVLRLKCDYAAAEPLLREALAMRRKLLGDEHPDVALSLNGLARVLFDKGDYAAAEPPLREVLAMRRSHFGDEHPDVRTSLINLAAVLFAKGDSSAAETVFRAAQEMARNLLTEEHPDIADSLSGLADMLEQKGDYARAEPLFREALAIRRKLLGDEHPAVALSLNELGSLLTKKGNYAAAEPLYREALAIRRKLLGDEHPAVALSLNALAVLLEEKGDHAGAEPLFREALAMRRKLLGDEHRDVARSLDNLGFFLKEKGDYAAAEPLLREALAMRRKLLGDEHLDVANSLNNLATCLRGQGDDDTAEPLLREALAIRRKLRGDEHREVADNLDALGFLLKEKGEYAAAEPLLREGLAMRRKLLGDEHLDVALSLDNLAVLLMAKGDHAGAEPLYREVLGIRRKLLGGEHPGVALALRNLAMVLHRKGDPGAAEPLLREALAMQRWLLPSGHVDLATTLSWYALALFNRGQYAEAESVLREALAIREKAGEQDSLLYLNDLIGLSRALVRQKNYPEAENLARKTVEMARANAGGWANAHVRGAVQVLVETLVASGKADEAILVQSDWVEDCRRLWSADESLLAEALAALGRLLLQQEDYAMAEPILRECLALRQKVITPVSPDYWRVMNTRSMLGGALAGQGAALIESDAPAAISRFAEAELLLVESAEWLTRNADRIPGQYRAARHREALERIVKLYASWDVVALDSGKADRATRWRDELNKLSEPRKAERSSPASPAPSVETRPSNGK